MSQIFKDSGGSPAPDIETLTGNVGGAVSPDGAFNIDIVGSGDILVTGNPGTNTLTISDSSPSDIETLTGNTGGAVSPDGSNNIDIVGSGEIAVTGTPGTNTLTISDTGETLGTGQTIGAVTADIITFALGATAGVFALEGRVAGFESTTPAGVGYQLFGTVRTDGAAATLIGTIDQVVNEEPALVGADATIVVSGNNAIVRVTGVAALTIDWTAHLEDTEITP